MMKTRGLRLLALLVIVLLGIQTAWAGTSGKAYTRATAYLKDGSPSAAGKVYLGTAATSSPAYANYNSSNGYFARVTSGEGTSKTTTYHFYVTANTGYKFTGWYTKDDKGEFVTAANSTVSGTTYKYTDPHYVKSLTSVSSVSGSSDEYNDFDLYASFIKMVQYSFVVPTNGSFSITNDGNTVANYASFTAEGAVHLSAIPDAGYRLKGWYYTTNGGATKTYFAFSDETDLNFTSNTTVGADFEIDDGRATFWVKGGSTTYTDLNKANTAAASGSKLIVVLNNGTIPAGTYTISSGVTLLIPYSASYDIQTAPKVVHVTGIAKAPALSMYKKLSLAKGAVINCSGQICVGGQIVAINGGNPSSLPRGSAGVLDLSRGGTINLKSGSKLYAWGFVQGQDMNQGNNTTDVGEIIAESGSVVWEDFQVGEWRGGTASSTIYGKRSSWRFFPFQSYTVQNIEAPITYKYGSTGNCYWAIYGNGQVYTVTFALIASSNSLFKLGSGASLKKWYDPTTDRVCYATSGTASLDALNLSAMGTSIKSSEYNLPIPANMHIILNSGTTTISNPMVMHAGSVVEIRTGATLTLNSNIYMFDKDDWNTYCMYAYYYRTYASLTNPHCDRGTGTTKDALEDARILVDGTLKFGTNGRLYSTTHGSNVMGNGGGQVQFGTLPSTTTMVMCTNLSDQNNVSVSYANLCNEDGSYTKSIASNTFNNVNGRWFVSTAASPKTDHTYSFTYIKSGAVYGGGGTNATTPAIYTNDKTGVVPTMKWVNVQADACDNWWKGSTDGYFYNYTLHNAWHQFLPTSTTIGSGEDLVTIYSGSDNELYAKTNCSWTEYGNIDSNCLYTIGGTKKAFVNGSFVALTKNSDDEAYHNTAKATEYYICFEGCTWHPATKISGSNKAYTVDGQQYIWYSGAWLAVEQEDSFFYSRDDNNVKIYYEYEGSNWVLATPVAEVTTSGNTEPVYKIADAFGKANTQTAPGASTTIKLMKNCTTTAILEFNATGICTLDLNGFTLSGTVSKMLNINNASATFIIIDQSADETGKVSLSYSADERRYAAYITQGTLILNGGIIASANTKAYDSNNKKQLAGGVDAYAATSKFIMNGGAVTVQSTYNPYAVCGEAAASEITINGGTITSETTTNNSPYAIISYGKININGGEIKAIAATTSAVGVYVYASTSKQGVLTMTGGEVYAESKNKNTATGILVDRGAAYSTTEPRTLTKLYPATANIYDGKVTAKTNGTTAQAIDARGTVNVYGGIFNANAGSTTGIGIRIYDCTTTVYGGTFNVTGTKTLYGVRISEEQPANSGVVYNGTYKGEGGKFTITSSSDGPVYGIYVGAHSRPVTTKHADNSSYYAGNYANAGTAIVNDGEFIVTSAKSSAYGVFVEKAETQSDATGYATATATPKCSINGGKYKVTSTNGSTSNVALTNNDAAKANFQILGGYYNEPAGATNYLSDYISAGKEIKDVDATKEAAIKAAGYTKKVRGQEYTVTWQTKNATGGTVTTTSLVENGKVPVYPGEGTPDSYTNSWATYDFKGWNTTDTGNNGAVLTTLPAVGTSDFTIYAIYKAKYAEVTANGTTTPYYSAQQAWNEAMKYKQATIRLFSHVNNMSQREFAPQNDNSTIILDLNNKYWIQNGADADRQKTSLINMTKAGCKLIVTDNSTAKGGYLQNKWGYTGDTHFYGIDVQKGELVLENGAIKCDNTTANTGYGKECFAVNVSATGKFTMLGGTLEATRSNASTTGGAAGGMLVYGTADITAGTINAIYTKGTARGVYACDGGTINIDGTVKINATGTTTQGVIVNYGSSPKVSTVNLKGGTVTATSNGGESFGLYASQNGIINATAPVVLSQAASNARGIYAIGNSSLITIEGGTFTSQTTEGNSSYCVFPSTNGTIICKDGTFKAISKGSTAAAINVQNANAKATIEGGTYTTEAGASGNNEISRIWGAGAKLTITGGQFEAPSYDALRSFQGDVEILGNPYFKTNTGVTCSDYAIADGIAPTVTIDGGTFECKSYALRAVTTTTPVGDATRTVTGHIIVLDGKFYSSNASTINQGSTKNLEIKGGYFSETSLTKAQLDNFVVAPSTSETLSEKLDGRYKYHVKTNYTVTFADVNNGTNTTKTYARNEVPSFDETTLKKTVSGQVFTFNGWDKEFAPVTGDVTYTAQWLCYTAEVLVGEATTGDKYVSVRDALDFAATKQKATVRLLNPVTMNSNMVYSPVKVLDSEGKETSENLVRDLTLDLNGYTFKGAPTTDAWFILNDALLTFTIKDSSTGGAGQLLRSQSASKNSLCTMQVTHGELVLESGKISFVNDAAYFANVVYVMDNADARFSMTGGTIYSQGGSDGARGLNTSGNTTISGGTIQVKADKNCYGILCYKRTTTFSGNFKLDVSTTNGGGAYGVYSNGANTICDIKGGTFTVTTTGGDNAMCFQALSNSKQNTISGGTFVAKSSGGYAHNVYVQSESTVSISGGKFDSEGVSQIYCLRIGTWESNPNAKNARVDISGGIFETKGTGSNIETVRVFPYAILNITGGTFKNDISTGLVLFGGTTTISGTPTIISKGQPISACGAFIGSNDDIAKITVNGGTFVSTSGYNAIYAASQTKEVSGTTKTQYADIIVNGGYFFTSHNAVVNKAGTSTIVLNGGKYNETSGSNHKDNITTYKGSTTTVTDINETVDSRTYKYELKTPYTITWKAGTSYTKTEQLQSGVTPTNTKVTSFTKADGKTYYFTGWTPAPTPVYADATYEAEGDYYEAEVRIGTGAWTRYTDFLEAWQDLQNTTTASAQIVLLNNITITDQLIYKPTATKATTEFDLNGFTLTYGGANDRILTVNKADATLTITDHSSAGDGTLYMKKDYASSLYCVFIGAGTLNMAGGRLYSENDKNDTSWHPATAVYVSAGTTTAFNMTGGTIEAYAPTYLAYTLSTLGTVKITGGKIIATTASTPRAVVVNGGTTTISGTVEVTATGKAATALFTTASISTDGKTIYTGNLIVEGGTFTAVTPSTDAYALYAVGTTRLASDNKYYAANSNTTIKGGKFYSKSTGDKPTQVFAVNVGRSLLLDSATPHSIKAKGYGVCTISGGEFTVETKYNGAVVGEGNIEPVRNYGELSITGGTFNSTTKSGVMAVRVFGGTVNISGAPVFNIESTASHAYAVSVADWTTSNWCDKDITNNKCYITIDGGTFNITANNYAYAANVMSAVTADVAGYALEGHVTINGGVFNLTGARAYDFQVRCPITATGSGFSTTATAELIVTGGKFMNKGTGNYNYNFYTYAGDSGAKAQYSITGGYYNTNLNSPNDLTSNIPDRYFVRTLGNTEDEYKEGYRYSVEADYKAKVNVGGKETKYTDVIEALKYAKTQANPTITILKDAPLTERWFLDTNTPDNWQGTLDLNGFTVTGTGSNYGMIDVTKAGIKLTIKDSSTSKTGKLTHEEERDNLWGINIDKGAELVLESGTIYVKSTKTDGGTSYGVYVNTSGGTFTQKGGKVEVTGVTSAIAVGMGASSADGTANISGGEITAQSTGNGKNVYGVYLSAAKSTANISGGTVTSTNYDNSSASISVYSYNGTAKITGGEFYCKRTQTGASNISNTRTGVNGTLIIKGGIFDATGYQAISIRGGQTTIDGGEFRATTGIRAMDWADAATVTAKLTINGGTFETTGVTLYLSSKNNDSRNAYSEVTINGGYFKSAGSSIVQMDATPSGATASTLELKGGFYNEKSGTTYKTQLEKYTSDPYEVFTLEDGDANKAAGYAYEVCEKRVAKVKVGSAVTYYTTVKAAFDYAANKTQPTIKLLADCNQGTTALTYNNTSKTDVTIDLNGHTIEGKVESTLLTLTAPTNAGTITIKDSGTGGQIKNIANANATRYGVRVLNGTLNLQGGKIYAENQNTGTSTGMTALQIGSSAKLNMAGAAIEVKSTRSAIGIVAESSATVDINDGTVNVTANECGAYGLYAKKSSSLTTYGGTFNITAKLQMAAKTTNVSSTAFGIYVNDADAYVEGGTFTITANCPSDFTADAYNVDGIRINGTDGRVITNGGTFTVTNNAKNKSSNGICLRAGYANVDGGKFTAVNGLNCIDYAAGNLSAEAIVDDGEFICTGAAILSGKKTNGSYTAVGEITIAGGKFKTTASTIVSCNSGATLTLEGGYYNKNTQVETYCVSPYHCMPTTAADKAVVGNEYNYKVTKAYLITFKDGDGNSLQSSYVYAGDMPTYSGTTPTKTDDDYTYTFKGWTPTIVAATADATYTATFTQNNIREYGSFFDIVDWTANASGKAEQVTLNMNGYSSSLSTTDKTATYKNGWKVSVLGSETEYTMSNFDAARLVAINIADRSLAPNDQLMLVGKDKYNAVESHQRYTVPFVITKDTKLSSLSSVTSSSILFIKSGKLTVDKDVTVSKVIVCASAELEIQKTLTVTGRLILRTEAWQAAVLTDNGTLNCSEVFYSRVVHDKSQSYQIGFPFDVDLSKTVLSNGKNATFRTHYGIQYYDAASRSEYGKDGKDGSGNWQTLTTPTLEANKGYQILSSSAYYYEILFPVAYSKTTGTKTLSVTAYSGNSGDPIDQGWNYLVSPYTQRYTHTGTTPENYPKINTLHTDNRTFSQDVLTTINPAMPFYYQAAKTGNLTLGSAFTAPAPLRRESYTEVQTQWLRLWYASAEMEDVTNIYLHPDKFSVEYETEYDVVKLSKDGGYPLIYTSVSYGDMAFTALPDSMAEQGIALTVYSPTAQEMTFRIEDNPFLARLSQLYLIDLLEDRQVDLLLTDYTYDAAAGTTAGRFLLRAVMRDEQTEVTTSVEKTTAGVSLIATVIDRKVVVLQAVEGKMVYLYDATGRLVSARIADTNNLTFTVPAAGVYILRQDSEIREIIVR